MESDLDEVIQSHDRHFQLAKLDAASPHFNHSPNLLAVSFEFPPYISPLPRSPVRTSRSALLSTSHLPHSVCLSYYLKPCGARARLPSVPSVSQFCYKLYLFTF
jgi:hypothetical protein